MDLLTVLILLLGHDSFRMREAAHRVFLALGPDSLPLIFQLKDFKFMPLFL